jgi:DNA mismatch repair protein MutS
MYVDEQTLRDLELIECSDGNPSVVDLLDFTQTRRGAQALRVRLTSPMRSVRHIEAVQDSVRFLGHHRIRLDLERGLFEKVVRYLDSSYDVLQGRSRIARTLESWWMAVRYKDLIKHAAGGVAATRRLLGGIEELTSRITELEPPREVTRYVDDIQSILDGLDLSTDSVGGGVRLLDADRSLRYRHHGDLTRLLDLVAELDALCSMAEAARRHGLTLPSFQKGDTFQLEGSGLRHLFVEEAVENPVRVSGGETLVFLTGPNMAGKTTYLKAVAVALHLAHCGMAVPARSLRLTRVDALLTSLRPEDNLRAGLSFFMAEVLRVKDVATRLAEGQRLFVLFDEIFRGTNVRDALEASKTVIQGFARAGSSGFILSSHLVELADDLAGNPAVRFEHFEGHIVEGTAQYEFRLKEGVSRQRLGVHLLNQEGVADLLAAIPA